MGVGSEAVLRGSTAGERTGSPQSCTGWRPGRQGVQAQLQAPGPVAADLLYSNSAATRKRQGRLQVPCTQHSHTPAVGCAGVLRQQQPCSERYSRRPIAASVINMAATPRTMTTVSGVAM